MAALALTLVLLGTLSITVEAPTYKVVVTKGMKPNEYAIVGVPVAVRHEIHGKQFTLREVKVMVPASAHIRPIRLVCLARARATTPPATHYLWPEGERETVRRRQWPEGERETVRRRQARGERREARGERRESRRFTFHFESERRMGTTIARTRCCRRQGGTEVNPDSARLDHANLSPETQNYPFLA